MKVEVVRSPRRRKTVQAREVNGVLRVSIPATMSEADEERWVAEMLRRMARRAGAGAVELTERAAYLARRYDLPVPAAIRWVDNQEWRWGSCTPTAGTVRISSRLAREPGWVLDYVVVHELAHLEVARHDRRFWALVNRYPLTERARGFLIARGMEPADPSEAVPAAATAAAPGRPAGGFREPPARTAAARRARRKPAVAAARPDARR